MGLLCGCIHIFHFVLCPARILSTTQSIHYNSITPGHKTTTKNDRKNLVKLKEKSGRSLSLSRTVFVVACIGWRWKRFCCVHRPFCSTTAVHKRPWWSSHRPGLCKAPTRPVPPPRPRWTATRTKIMSDSMLFAVFILQNNISHQQHHQRTFVGFRLCCARVYVLSAFIQLFAGSHFLGAL